MATSRYALVTPGVALALLELARDGLLFVERDDFVVLFDKITEFLEVVNNEHPKVQAAISAEAKATGRDVELPRLSRPGYSRVGGRAPAKR